MPNDNVHEGNLHRRFVMRVLAPPFIALLALSLIGLWQLDIFLRRQALENLQRSAATTASALEREFSLRETVLKRTGAELIVIKSEYLSSRLKLDQNRNACREFIRVNRNFRNSPDGVCEPFAVGLANKGASFAALEDEYVVVGQALIADQDQRINERLSAFKQFFPETLAILVTDSNKQVVSSALSGAFKGSIDAFTAYGERALTDSIYGHQTTAYNFQLGIFAFPVAGGSVLAGFDLYNEQFIKQTWDLAPIDRKQALAVILDAENNVAYPNIKNSEVLQQNGQNIRANLSVEAELDGVKHTLSGVETGASKWLVVIASPTAAVLAPLRNAQSLGLIFIGFFMVGFTWVGSFFIQRTLKNIVRLVGGAMVFGAGKLDYKIELDRADREFVQLGETLNLMAERIAAAERVIDEKNREFISVATHEIRTPLTSIIGYLTLLQELYSPKLDKQANTLIDQAYYGSARLRDLVNDMLNAARLESGRSEFTLAPVDIIQVVTDVIDTMDVVAKISKTTLHYSEENATHVLADEGRLRIIINNFVSNAIKYNKIGGKVEVFHQLNESQLTTGIRDNGLGIPEDQKARMFEKFFRVEHEDRKSVTGTGLGMYITKQYIEEMGGKLWFESTHGIGTTFYFSLPVARQTLRSKLGGKIKNTLRKAGRKTQGLPRPSKLRPKAGPRKHS